MALPLAAARLRKWVLVLPSRCVCVCVCVRACVSVCLCVSVRACVFVLARGNGYWSLDRGVCVRVRVRACMRVFVRIHTYTHAYIGAAAAEASRADSE